MPRSIMYVWHSDVRVHLQLCACLTLFLSVCLHACLYAAVSMQHSEQYQFSPNSVFWQGAGAAAFKAQCSLGRRVLVCDRSGGLSGRCPCRLCDSVCSLAAASTRPFGKLLVTLLLVYSRASPSRPSTWLPAHAAATACLQLSRRL